MKKEYMLLPMFLLLISCLKKEGSKSSAYYSVEWQSTLIDTLSIDAARESLEVKIINSTTDTLLLTLNEGKPSMKGTFHVVYQKDSLEAGANYYYHNCLVPIPPKKTQTLFIPVMMVPTAEIIKRKHSMGFKDPILKNGSLFYKTLLGDSLKKAHPNGVLVLESLCMAKSKNYRVRFR